MRLHSKMIYDSQSLSTLDIPTELLTSINFTATHQKKRMIVPASVGSCCLFLLYTALPAVVVCISIMSGVIYCLCCRDKNQEMNYTTIQEDAKEVNTEPVMVATVPIAADEKSCTNKNDTVIEIQIDDDTSDESDSSSAQVVSST